MGQPVSAELAQRSIRVETRGSRRAAARTAILSNSSPSSGLPWASVAIRAAGRGSESRLYCGDSNMGERQRRPQQQTTVGKQLVVQSSAARTCTATDSPASVKEERRRLTVRSHRSGHHAHNPSHNRQRQHSRIAALSEARTSTARQRYARIVCSTRGR